MLTHEQILLAYEQAMINLQHTDYKFRHIGVNLLAELICRLDQKHKKKAIHELLYLFDDWQAMIQANHFTWFEFDEACH